MQQRLIVLVVDDLVKKQEAIIAALTSKLRMFEFTFSVANSYESARERLQARNYDFVVLDVKIPAGNEPASERWSRQLLRDIVEGKLCFPMHVFGVTEHRDIADVERAYYEENMFGFFVFEWGSHEWATNMAVKIQYLAAAMQNGAAYRLNSFEYDLLILTARHEREFVPIRKSIFGTKKSTGHPLWRDGAHFGQLSIGGGRKLRTALICIGETGLAPAATITTQAIHLLRPRTVVMLGMCAGFEDKGVRLLDVLIARETACWQEGKMTEDDSGEKLDLRGKVRGWSTDLGGYVARQLEMQGAEFGEILEEFSRKKEYLGFREQFGAQVSQRPRILPGLVVSGSAVVANDKMVSEVIRRHPLAVGLEMEIFAVYTAASLAVGRRSEFVAIKGVADLGDGEKKDAMQSLASELSALVLKRLLEMVADQLYPDH